MKNNKKEFIFPVIDNIIFEENDIILTSGNTEEPTHRHHQDNYRYRFNYR